MITEQGYILLTFISFASSHLNTYFIFSLIFALISLISWRLFVNPEETSHLQYLVIFVTAVVNWITLGFISIYLYP